MPDPQRKFIVSIRQDVELDVDDVQEAIMDIRFAGQLAIKAGNVDVELVEVVHGPERVAQTGATRLEYKVLEGI